MKRNWTRRKFLKNGLGSSVSLGAMPVTPQRDSARETLRAAMDEIVPASDGMPAASAAGALQYLDEIFRRAPALRNRFAKGIAALEQVARRRFQKDFVKLSRDQRVESLRELEERASPAFFADLRDYVYEAYYTRPEIWKWMRYA